ncbi:MAG: ABC transporter substrate-binding protein [Candidatus Kapaibacterium sp.]
MILGFLQNNLNSTPSKVGKLTQSTQLFTFLVLGLSATLLIGCAGDSGRKDSNTFFFNMNSEPNSLDPIQISQQASWWIGEQIYDGLLTLDSNMDLAPALARSWETSEDGLTWTFHLRSDARFCDDPSFADGKGRPVTAEDVRYSFERVCTPGKSSGFWIFRGKVDGADEFYKSRENSENGNQVEHVVGFTVVDDSTFTITLTTPFSPFAYTLTTPFGYIVPREAVEKYGQDFFRNPVGTGPFRMTEWEPGRQIILVRNGNYYEQDEAGKPLPYLDSVVGSFKNDAATEFAEFQKGNLDLLTTIDPTFAGRILSEDGSKLSEEFSTYKLYSKPGMSVEYYGITLDPTTRAVKEDGRLAENVYLRRAINYGIDREKITSFVLKGQAIPAENGPIPPSTPGFTGVKGYSYNPDKAREMLDSAGYPNGDGLKPILLQVSNNQRTGSVAQAVMEDLKKLGIPVELRQTEHATHLKQADDGEVGFWRTSWLADYPHAENFMANFYGPYSKPAGPNRARYHNPKVDSLYLAAMNPALTKEGWSNLYGQMEEIVLQDAPWIFLYYSVVRHLTQPWIENYHPTPLQTFDLTRVRKNTIPTS